MADFFDPDAIRGDIELAITQLFKPSVYSAAQSYVAGDRVRLNDQIYVATAPTIGSTPPSAAWTLDGPAYPIIYENVESAFGQQGGIRVAISWNETTDASIGSNSGILRSIGGVVSVWIFTPRNRGTSPGLKASMRLRDEYLKWNRIGTCGKGVRISGVSGPRIGGGNQGDDYYMHVVSARLTVMEQVSYVR